MYMNPAANLSNRTRPRTKSNCMLGLEQQTNSSTHKRRRQLKRWYANRHEAVKLKEGQRKRSRSQDREQDLSHGLKLGGFSADISCTHLHSAVGTLFEACCNKTREDPWTWSALIITMVCLAFLHTLMTRHECVSDRSKAPCGKWLQWANGPFLKTAPSVKTVWLNENTRVVNAHSDNLN